MACRKAEECHFLKGVRPNGKLKRCSVFIPRPASRSWFEHFSAVARGHALIDRKVHRILQEVHAAVGVAEIRPTGMFAAKNNVIQVHVRRAGRAVWDRICSSRTRLGRY